MATTAKLIRYLGFFAISQNCVVDYNYYLLIHDFEFVEVNVNSKNIELFTDLFFMRQNNYYEKTNKAT